MTNRAFEDLQKRCVSINRKRYIKYSLLFLVLLVAGCSLFLEVTKHDIKKPLPKRGIKKVEKKQIKPKKVLKKVEKPTIKKQKAKAVKVDYNTTLLNATITIPEISTQPKQPKKQEKIETTVKKKIVAKKVKFKMQVKSLENLDALLQKNSSNESFETTMKLSKYYLSRSKYKKAIYWSKKANHYRPSSFEPWLIYAKAKIKLHKKSEGIKAVEMFLGYFDSDQAREFLRKMKEEK